MIPIPWTGQPWYGTCCLVQWPRYPQGYQFRDQSEPRWSVLAIGSLCCPCWIQISCGDLEVTLHLMHPLSVQGFIMVRLIVSFKHSTYSGIGGFGVPFPSLPFHGYCGSPPPPFKSVIALGFYLNNTHHIFQVGCLGHGHMYWGYFWHSCHTSTFPLMFLCMA